MKNIPIPNHSNVNLSEPDVCPMCHNGIDPIYTTSYINTARWNSPLCLQVIWRCSKHSCDKLFISYYSSNSSSCGSGNLKLEYSKPINVQERTFNSTLKEISINFCNIYNESFKAEQDGLLEICGVGYRKSLEFLIKDYAKLKDPTKTENIEKQTLASCIKDYINSENIKEVSKRAVWLGNDETHYIKKWESKDLNDLKKLIDLTIYWIEAEKLTEEIKNDMPEV